MMFFDGNEINIDYLTFLEKNSFDNFKKYDYQDNFINSKYYSVDEGFIKGNMFVNEYKPYKNYKVNTIKATNEKDALLNKLMAYNFAFNDMNARLKKYLLDVASINNGNVVVKTHQEIAYELNTSRVVISRLLKALEKEEFLELNRNEITIK